MVSRRVTHESDLQGRRGWWLRLQGAQLLVERAWRGMLEEAIQQEMTEPGGSQGKSCFCERICTLKINRTLIWESEGQRSTPSYSYPAVLPTCITREN